MTALSFIINYQMFLTNNAMEIRTTKVKNCLSELQAKSRLEDYLKRKNPMFSKLVILSCKKSVGGMFDFMGSDNPFKNW